LKLFEEISSRISGLNPGRIMVTLRNALLRGSRFKQLINLSGGKK
jgi:hypothetical protein